MADSPSDRKVADVLRAKAPLDCDGDEGLAGMGRYRWSIVDWVAHFGVMLFVGRMRTDEDRYEEGPGSWEGSVVLLVQLLLGCKCVHAHLVSAAVL